MDNYKDLALSLMSESKNDAVESIAQEVLDKHLEMETDGFDDTLMPEEEFLPPESDVYLKIKEMIEDALKQGVSKIENLK